MSDCNTEGIQRAAGSKISWRSHWTSLQSWRLMRVSSVTSGTRLKSNPLVLLAIVLSSFYLQQGQNRRLYESKIGTSPTPTLFGVSWVSLDYLDSRMFSPAASEMCWSCTCKCLEPSRNRRSWPLVPVLCRSGGNSVPRCPWRNRKQSVLRLSCAAAWTPGKVRRIMSGWRALYLTIQSTLKQMLWFGAVWIKPNMQHTAGQFASDELWLLKILCVSRVERAGAFTLLIHQPMHRLCARALAGERLFDIQFNCILYLHFYMLCMCENSLSLNYTAPQGEYWCSQSSSSQKSFIHLHLPYKISMYETPTNTLVGSEVHCNYQAALGKLAKCIVSYDSTHMVHPEKRFKCMCRLSGLEEKIHICTVLGQLFFEQNTVVLTACSAPVWGERNRAHTLAPQASNFLNILRSDVAHCSSPHTGDKWAPKANKQPDCNIRITSCGTDRGVDHETGYGWKLPAIETTALSSETQTRAHTSFWCLVSELRWEMTQWG